MDVYVCMHIYKLVYYYKVTSFPEDWMHAHLNLPVNVCVYILYPWRQDKDYYVDDDDDDDDVVMIDFYVADKRWWWQMKRQTVLHSPHQH
jgi:hypothetical protein